MEENNFNNKEKEVENISVNVQNRSNIGETIKSTEKTEGTLTNNLLENKSGETFPNEETSTNDKEILNERLKKSLKKLKQNKNWVIYGLLAIIILIAVRIRTLNIPRLRDITTNDWTLGPDLDPFLFLRWAEYIAENGKLFVIDTFRNVPLGFNTSGESQLLSYMIAWFFHLLNALPNFLINKFPGSPTEITITYAGILFPVFMFLLTVIAFFFLTKEIFKGSFENKLYPNIIALIASFFLSVTPSLLPRTIAGIPEKESAAFLFIFLSLYFILKSFKSKNNKKIIINSLLAGISTGTLGLVWGGINFLLISVGIFAFALFILGQLDKKRLLGYGVWIITFIPIMIYFSARYNLGSFVTWIPSIAVLTTFVLSSFDIFIYPKIKNNKHLRKIHEKYSLPREFISLILVGVSLSIIALVFFGPEFFTSKFNSLYNQLVRTLTSTRFTATVAENRQPFFVGEWKSSFGPIYQGIPLMFWSFISGSLILFLRLIKKFKTKEKIWFSIAYLGLIFGPIFSRYSSSSVFNGSNMESNILYFGGVLFFVIYTVFILHRYNKKDQRDSLPKDIGIILLLSYFFISILGARGAVRFVMVLVPPASILIGYLVVKSFEWAKNKKSETTKLLAWGIFALILISTLFSGMQFYNISSAQASSFHPSSYQFQWQKAMSWVRDNTSEDAVFSHWWDYGYWLQSIGKRATVLDGGNAIVYWNHLMGRHVLTGPDDELALEFLKTHKATHLLIDSTDIGKYSAFSSIGGDENNDRFSFIPSFFLDNSLTQETSNGLIRVYSGGTGLDEDIIFENNGTEIRLARENTGIGAIVIEEGINGELLQPRGVFVQSNQQVQIPLRYLYVNNELRDFEEGIEAGVFIIETLTPQGNSITKDDKGALMYLSKRTVNSLLVRKFLFEEEGSFKLAHVEPNPLTEDLRNQGFEVDDFSYFQGNFLGPIKIWEISYPGNIKENPAFLEVEYPDARLI